MNNSLSEVTVDQIEVVEKFNPRDTKDYYLDELESVIDPNIGLLTPLLVMESDKTTEDGKPIYKLFEGHRRFNKLCENNNPQVKIVVRIFPQMGEHELLKRALILGNTGRQLNTMSKIRAINKLQGFGVDNKEIANILRITTSQVSLLKKFNNLPVEIQNFINEETINFLEAIKLFEKVENKSALIKLIAETKSNNNGKKVTPKNLKDTLEKTEDVEIKNIQDQVNGDLTIRDRQLQNSIELTFDQNITKENSEQVTPQNNNFEENTDNDVEDLLDVNNSDAKNNKVNKPKKLPDNNIKRLYELLTDDGFILTMQPNKEKVEVLSQLIKFEYGELNLEEISDYFCND